MNQYELRIASLDPFAHRPLNRNQGAVSRPCNRFLPETKIICAILLTLPIKPMETLTDDETSRLALMFEIAPRLAVAYRVKKDSLTVIRPKSSVEGKPRLAN